MGFASKPYIGNYHEYQEEYNCHVDIFLTYSSVYFTDIEIIFFAYLLQFAGMRQQTNHHQSWLRQTKHLPMMNRSSGHQNHQIR